MNNELTATQSKLNSNVRLNALMPSVTQIIELMTAGESVNVEVQS